MRGFAISEKNENKYVNIHLVTRTRLSDCKTQMYSICPNPVWDYQMYLFVHSVRHTKAKLHPVCFIPTCSSVSFTIFHFYFDTYVSKRKKIILLGTDSGFFINLFVWSIIHSFLVWCIHILWLKYNGTVLLLLYTAQPRNVTRMPVATLLESGQKQ